jgi:hypothetical protein
MKRRGAQGVAAAGAYNLPPNLGIPGTDSRGGHQFRPVELEACPVPRRSSTYSFVLFDAGISRQLGERKEQENTALRAMI